MCRRALIPLRPFAIGFVEVIAGEVVMRARCSRMGRRYRKSQFDLGAAGIIFIVKHLRIVPEPLQVVTLLARQPVAVRKPAIVHASSWTHRQRGGCRWVRHRRAGALASARVEQPVPYLVPHDRPSLRQAGQHALHPRWSHRHVRPLSPAARSCARGT